MCFFSPRRDIVDALLYFPCLSLRLSLSVLAGLIPQPAYHTQCPGSFAEGCVCVWGWGWGCGSVRATWSWNSERLLLLKAAKKKKKIHLPCLPLSLPPPTTHRRLWVLLLPTVRPWWGHHSGRPLNRVPDIMRFIVLRPIWAHFIKRIDLVWSPRRLGATRPLVWD